MPPPTEALRATVERLAALERLPCSPGEREAAEWIAARLGERGAEARIEEERVHGSFIVPIGLLSAAGALAGAAVLTGRRAAGLVAAAAGAAMWEDLSGGSRRWFRRRALPQQTTTNVVAEAGDRGAERTLVVHAHHDAARTSFIFDQTAPRLAHERLPWLIERIDRWPPLMWLVVGGPLAVAAGALAGRRGPATAGTAIAAGTAAVMAHMLTQPVVPGANDNLTGVAVLIELAARLERDPVQGLRVLLVSAGAEESNQEGMLAFARRHLPELPRRRTTFLCVDTVGSPELVLIEGEGFIRMRDYPPDVKDAVARAADDTGVHLRRGLRLTFATDGLVPLRAGYPAASLGSVNEWLVPSNYHWPTDTPDRVDYDSVAGAATIAERFARALAADPPLG